MSSPFHKLCPLWVALSLIPGLVCSALAQRLSIDSLAQSPTMTQLIRQSAVIFSGTVLKVEHHSANRPGELGTVQTTFLVQQAARGVRAGQIFEIWEWAGLWESGERYRAGEQVVLLLYPRSKLGLTSPVGGALGHLNMNSLGEVTVRHLQIRNLSPGLSSNASHAASRVRARDLLHAIQREAEE